MKFICQVCQKKFEVLNRSKKYLETRKFCDLNCYRKSDVHTRTKFQKGHPPLREQLGEKNSMWKGDLAGYSSLHRWIRRHYGNPKKCQHCGVIGSRETGKWSIHWANRTGKHLRDIKDWIGLCCSCHVRQEKKIIRKRLSSRT